MRVLFLTPFADGGIGRYIANLGNALHRRGEQVRVVVTGRQSDRLGDELDALGPGMRVDYIEVQHAVAATARLALPVLRWGPQVVLANNLRLTIVALRLARLAPRRPRVYPVLHNTYSVLAERLAPGKRRRFLAKVRRYMGACDAVVAVSQGVAQDFVAWSGIPQERVPVIHNPVITARTLDLAEQPVDEPWLQGGQVPVIMGLGRLEQQKGFDVLIEAFERLRARRAARLIIVGDGSLRGALQAQAQGSPYRDDIRLPGFRDNPFAWMRRADLFVLSSNWEGLPTTLVEAAAVGVPVVATDCPHGPREILQGGALGPLVPPGDPAALAEAMAAVLDAPPRPEALRASAARFFDDAIAERYIDLFRMPG